MSKLNPQKASAYVGPGVLRKGGKITPVPNGPLVKKKGPYAGSTLKAGGKIKKAQSGGSYVTTKSGRVGRMYGENSPYESIDTTGYSKGKKEFDLDSSLPGLKKTSTKIKREDIPSKIKEFKKGAIKQVNLKAGGLIKRADGSYSKRGLWDNLRSKAAQNKKTGAKPKSPTKAMLTQEKKIKSKGK